MSRLGKIPVKIEDGVTVTVNNGVVTVKGPKGELKQELKGNITAEVKDGQVVFTTLGTDKQSLAYWGLYRSLVANMVEGVSKGFTKELEIIGVGYRASKTETGISLSVGYSHPVNFDAPVGVTLAIGENNKIMVSGFDKHLVTLTAAQIRAVRKPEPYKGKGIKYVDEVVRRKAGKAAIKAV